MVEAFAAWLPRARERQLEDARRVRASERRRPKPRGPGRGWPPPRPHSRASRALQNSGSGAGAASRASADCSGAGRPANKPARSSTTARQHHRQREALAAGPLARNVLDCARTERGTGCAYCDDRRRLCRPGVRRLLRRIRHRGHGGRGRCREARRPARGPNADLRTRPGAAGGGERRRRPARLHRRSRRRRARTPRRCSSPSARRPAAATATPI